MNTPMHVGYCLMRTREIVLLETFRNDFRKFYLAPSIWAQLAYLLKAKAWKA